MEKIRAKIIVSFRAKVLVPVLSVMVLMLALTVWVLNERITRQFEADGRHNLATANAVFQNSQQIRSKNLLLRFRNLPNASQYKSAFQLGHAPTIRGQLTQLLAEQGVDIVLFTPDDNSTTSPGETLFQRNDPMIPADAFERASDYAIIHALHGEEKADTIRVGEKLYDVVSIPVFGVGDAQIGALTFGSEIGSAVAQEFRRLTSSHIVFVANGHITASTLPVSASDGDLTELFKELSAGQRKTTTAAMPVSTIILGGDRYFSSAGQFSSLQNDKSLGYLLLTSYEQQQRALQATRQLLLGVSLAVILIGATVVWFLIRKITEPLRELRDSAEAVGQGDFSQRVAVRSQDECGELAMVFNQMTENIKSSREQLEHTVETLKNTQAQLVQSEKLAGIGEFISGVAHELNNPLTSVIGFSELLGQTGSDQQKRHLDMIHKSAIRCQKIVQALLSFARKHQPERKPVCVNGLLEAALEILLYQLRTSNIEIRTKLDPQLPLAMVDAHQMQQVFLNIINNARQAIEAHQPKGWIKITTEARGSNVHIVIQDNGPGIKPESLSKIFDPFFTTKEVGKGTGLGLSLCYGIVREHGGTITPQSRPGEGATFVIELPITQETVARVVEEKRAPDTDIINPNEGAGKKVLVIDDEEPILQMLRESLSRRGYEVDTAPDGETGLSRVKQNRYDVLLCDWKMPGLNGQEVYERLRSNNREMANRVIFITGDVVNNRIREFLETNNRVCLPKPFSQAEFRNAINKVLTSQ